jgi:nitroimidazol reductase NimA-like FMN-containing flavoprotein (pyridoxamine 5'-phosphate oxidase superfamily)
MLVHELTRDDCAAVLQRATIARLASVRDDEPYVVPIHVAFDGYHLYGLSALGRKIEAMRAHPRVCVEVDEIQDPGSWTSVLVFGDYEELTRSDDEAARTWAERLLMPRAQYWLPAFARGGGNERATAVVYRIRIARMTGRGVRRSD